MIQRAQRWKATLVAFGLVIGIACVYAPVGDFGFVSYDDPEYVAANAEVRRGVSAHGLRWALTGVHHGNWHPITTLSYMLESEIFGLDPGAQHLVNAILHGANTLLLFLLLLRTTGALWKSAAVAALFAVHPLHVESVAWISSRKDLLSAGLAFAATHAYVGWVRSPRAGRYVAVLLLFGLGLMSKPMLVTWPFVLLLLDVWPLGRFEIGGRHRRGDLRAARARAIRAALLEKTPLLALSGVAIALTLWAQRIGGGLKSTPLHPLDARIANALISYVAYLERTVWPTQLAVLYPFPQSIAPWHVFGSATVLAVVTGTCVGLRRRHPYALVGWLWFLGTLVPVIGLVQVGAQASADRYTYLPLVGIFVMGVVGLGRVVERRRDLRLMATAFTCVVLVLLGSLAARQVRLWEDSVTLYRHGLRATAPNAVLSNNLGIALGDAGRDLEAIRVYEEALAHRSLFVHVLHYNAGIALARTGRHSEALAHFDATLRLDPEHAEALYHRAGSLEALGRLEAARRDLERVVGLAPGRAEPQFELGLVLGKLGDLSGANRHLSRALEIQPRRVDARINLAVALLKSGEPRAAIRELETVLRIAPDHEAALGYLARARESLSAR